MFPGAGVSICPYSNHYFSERFASGFYINLPPAGLSMLIILALSIPEQMPKKPVRSNWRHIVREMDFLGFILFAPAVTMFLIAIMWGGNQHAWNSATIIGLLVGSVVITAIFVVWQIHLDDRALIPPKVMKNRLVWSGCINSAFLMGPLVLLAYYLPLWFQIVKGVNATLSGVMTLPIVVSQSAGSVIFGKLGLLSEIFEVLFTTNPLQLRKWDTLHHSHYSETCWLQSAPDSSPPSSPTQGLDNGLDTNF